MVKAMSARSTAACIVATVARDSTGPYTEHQVSWRHRRLSRMSGTMSYWRDEGCVSVMRTFNAMFVLECVYTVPVPQDRMRSCKCTALSNQQSVSPETPDVHVQMTMTIIGISFQGTKRAPPDEPRVDGRWCDVQHQEHMTVQSS